jgi:hypothetical protein
MDQINKHWKPIAIGVGAVALLALAYQMSGSKEQA